MSQPATLLPANAASHLRIRVEPRSELPLHVWLTDVRLQGQTPELASYIRRTLTFAPPWPTP